MGAAERLILEGKDYFREVEAAEYCGLSVDKFREWYKEVNIIPKRVGGRKLYSRADLFRAIDSSPEWQPNTNAAQAGTSPGPKMDAKSGSRLGGFRPARQRDYVPRKRQN